MPLSITNVVGGEVHPSPFLGPIDQTGTVRVDVSALTTDEVDVNGYLKPGVLLTRLGLLVGSDGVLLEAGGLAIATVAPEKYQHANTLDVLINGRQVTVAAQNEIVFTAAHVINANTFGVILIQVNIAGTLSSKVPLATQAYATAALALAALPQADAGHASIGHIAVENDGVLWTGNTDDLTNASDVTTAAFVDADIQSAVQNAQRGYGAVVEAVEVAAGNTAALLLAATDIDVTVAVACGINRDIMEDSLGRSLTDDELYNISDSIIISPT